MRTETKAGGESHGRDEDEAEHGGSGRGKSSILCCLASPRGFSICRTPSLWATSPTHPTTLSFSRGGIRSHTAARVARPRRVPAVCRRVVVGELIVSRRAHWEDGEAVGVLYNATRDKVLRPAGRPEL